MSEKNKQRNEVRTHGNNLLFSAYKKLIWRRFRKGNRFLNAEPGRKENSHCNRRISGKTGNGPDGSGYLKGLWC